MVNKISIIIIGYNTADSLKNLLISINELQRVEEAVEIVYIDDGSNDKSMEIFKTSNLQFQKSSYKFTKNRGRVFSRNKGVELSSGDWLLFLPSNVLVHNMLLVEYLKIIKKYSALAFIGRVKYSSLDPIFERYLNHNKRGINNFENGATCPFKFLLFSNCFIHKSVFQKIQFNTQLINYGGEELEFAYRFQQLYPQKIRVCKKAEVARINHLGLWKHCDRIYEFGATNFILLNKDLKKEIIQYPFLLINNWLIIKIVEKIFVFLYNWGATSYYIIRFILLSHLLRGYFTAQKSQNHQIQDLG